MKTDGSTAAGPGGGKDMLKGGRATGGGRARRRTGHAAPAAGSASGAPPPADLVKKVLTDKPKALGLAVPGMPAGSPGMEMGGRADRFDVMAFDRTGKVWTYAKR